MTAPCPASDPSRLRRPGPLSRVGSNGNRARAGRSCLAARACLNRELERGCAREVLARRERLVPSARSPPRAASSACPRGRRASPLTPPVTPALSFDRADAEDRDARVTSMTRARPARSAFRSTNASFVRGRLRGPCARSPATKARLCRRAWLPSLAFALGSPFRVSFEALPRPLLRSSQTRSAAPALAGFGRGVERARRRLPSIRSASTTLGSKKPRGERPHGRRARCGPVPRRTEFPGRAHHRQGPASLPLRRLDRRLSSACAFRAPTILSLPRPRRARAPRVAGSWRWRTEKPLLPPGACLRR